MGELGVVIAVKKVLEESRKHWILFLLVGFGFILISSGILLSSYALVEPVGSVSLFSSNLSYESKIAGSWKVEKDAHWTERGKAQIDVQVSTVPKVSATASDIILVFDTSDSMYGKKLDALKSNTMDFLDSIFVNPSNRVALVSYGTNSTILSDFTNDKQKLMDLVNNLSTTSGTNYSSAFSSVDDLLKNYLYEEDRDINVLLLTDGVPVRMLSYISGWYNYLKTQYPYITIQAIQYEIADTVFDSIKMMSDNQYIASMDNLSEVLIMTAVHSIPYNHWILTDTIDTDYFDIDSIVIEESSFGEVLLENENISWNLSGLKSGADAQLTIQLSLKEEFLEEDNLFPISKNQEIFYEIDSNSEAIISTDVPILKQQFSVSYNSNLPTGCDVTDVPQVEKSFVYDIVELEDMSLKCDGWMFKGWSISTEDVHRLGNDYFIMPESDVTLRAEWSKLSITKSMDGKVQAYVPPVMRNGANSASTSGTFWYYRSSISKLIIQNQMVPISGASRSWDISEARNGSVMAYLVLNPDGKKYTAYIQGDGGVIAPEDSTSLFNNFTVLTEIEGLEYLDTSNVTTMASMFGSCENLVSLDLSSFDTSKVTNMYCMLRRLYNLTFLDVSSFDTSQVTNMWWMFESLKLLETLDLSNFDTSKVTNMRAMIGNCSVLTELNLKNFNTINVTNMSGMFGNSKALKNIIIDHFDFRNVTEMGSMFNNCNNLTMTITINCLKTPVYSGMFSGAATLNGAKITVNYVSSTSSLVSQMVSTKSSSSNVVKGSLIS